MFESSLALRYLLPRRRKLSLSLISLVSTLVIATVVWLVIVFLSVTDGLEQKWLQGLVSLHGPCRLEPKESYYTSYDYLIDRYSEQSGYHSLSLIEKSNQLASPYQPGIDPTLPPHFPSRWQPPNTKQKIALLPYTLDVVHTLPTKKPVAMDSFCYSFGEVRFQLSPRSRRQNRQIKQHAVVHSILEHDPYLADMLLPPSAADLKNLYTLLLQHPPSKLAAHELKRLFTHCTVFISQGDGQKKKLPNALLPAFKDGQYILPLEGTEVELETLSLSFRDPQTKFTAPPSLSPLWIYQVDQIHLPFSPLLGQGTLTSSSLQEQGLTVGACGSIHYKAIGGTSAKEMQAPCYTAGFYTAALGGLGSKLIFAPKDFVSEMARAQLQQGQEGYILWAQPLEEVSAYADRLQTKLKQAGLASYWNVSTFHTYDFSREFVQQLKSDRLLLSLISAIILLVAGSNIVSMLLILVHDKRNEIGILRALGAKSRSILLLFAFCGLAIGAVSASLGTAAAWLTLANLDSLAAFLSFLQGHEAFSEAFYGKSLPKEMSLHVLLEIWSMTLLISLLAATIPACKACLLKPTEILRKTS